MQSIITKNSQNLIIWTLLCGGLYLTSLYSYVLFHIVAESFSVFIAFSLFVIAWNTRRLTNNHYVLFLGIAFLFVGIIDFVHMLSYKGMGIFRGFDSNLPTQLWIIARYLQSLSFLVMPWFIYRKPDIRAVFGFYIFITLLLLAAVFSGALFPDCFIEGRGLTPFKIVSEYVICTILMLAMALLLRHREKFDPSILRLMVWSILFTIISELAFTFYINVYGLSNLIGHYFKIFAFYLVYRAIIVTGLDNPYRLLFYDLQRNREELQTILDASPIMIFYKDRENKFIRVNKALAEATALPKEAMEGKTAFEIYPNQLKDYWEDDKEVIASGKSKTGIIEPIDSAAGQRWLRTDKIPYRDMNGNIMGVIGFSIDITERKQMEEEIRQDKEKYQSILENIQEGYFEVNFKGNFTFCNDSMARLTGCTKEELIGMNHKQFTNKETAEKVFQEFNKVYLTGEPSKAFDWLIINKDGTEGYVEASITLKRDSSGKPLGFEGMIRDVTERKRIEEQIKHLSTHDVLTDLPTMRLAKDRLKMAISLAQRNRTMMAVMFIDLDGFKEVNDTLGHDAGDYVLKQVANRLLSCVRASDTVARVGGDEFLIIANGIHVPENASQIAEKVIRIISQPVIFNERQTVVGASIGIALCPNDGQDIDQLIKQADETMYRIKNAGKNSFSFANTGKR